MKKLFLVVLLMLHGSVWAEWVFVAETNQDFFYIDPATIRKDGNMRRVWRLTSFKQPSKGGTLSHRDRSEFDCTQERYRILELSAHSEPMAGGKTTSIEQGNGLWSEIPPGTAIEEMLKIVCSK